MNSGLSETDTRLKSGSSRIAGTGAASTMWSDMNLFGMEEATQGLSSERCGRLVYKGKLFKRLHARFW